MVDPTLTQRLVALAFVIVFLAFVVCCIVGISIRARRFAAKLNAGNSNAAIDAKILVAENVHVTNDPTIPFTPYAAVNEALEHRRRKG